MFAYGIYAVRLKTLFSDINELCNLLLLTGSWSYVKSRNLNYLCHIYKCCKSSKKIKQKL